VKSENSFNFLFKTRPNHGPEWYHMDIWVSEKKGAPKLHDWSEAHQGNNHFGERPHVQTRPYPCKGIRILKEKDKPPLRCPIAG